MKTIRNSIALVMSGLLLISCSDKSLQKYLVEKQDDPKFVKVDIPTSLLEVENSSFDQEEREILKSIEKINVVAYPIKNNDSTDYNSERQELESILDQEQYKDLTRIKTSDWNATLKYIGEEDAIDEVIVYANDSQRGFAIFRLTGKNMRPDQMYSLMKSIESGDLDLSKFNGMGEIFKD